MARAESSENPTVQQEPEFRDVLEVMRLFWSVEHSIERVSQQMVTDYGITMSQRLVLGFIARAPGIRPGELARMLHIHRSTLSGIIRRLENGGYVVREEDPDDARMVLLYLSRKGKWLKDNSICVESIFSSALAKLSDGEAAAMRRALEVFAAEFAAANEPSGLDDDHLNVPT